MAVWSSLANAMRIATSWIGKRITSWLIGQLIVWLVTVWLGWMLTNLIEDVKKALTEFNDAMLEKVFVVEDLLFQIRANIYGAADSLLETLQTNTIGALDNFTPDGNAALKTMLGWAEWVDSFFADIGAAIGDAAGVLISPITSKLTAAKNAIQGVEDSLNNIENQIIDLLSVYNNNILAIKARLEAGMPIDWNSYLLTLDDLDIDLIPDSLQNIKQDIIDAQNSLLALPLSLTNQFNSVISIGFKARLEAFLDAAFVAAVRAKQAEINNYFTEMRTGLTSELDASQQALINKTTELRNSIQETELAIIDKLPEILKPTLLKAVDRIKAQIMEQEEGIIVNVDQFLIDTRTVDQLLQRLKTYPSSDLPAKFDTVEWTLNDIHRILINYFFRHERMALAVAIAAQDMSIETDEFLALMAETAPYDDTEDVEDAYENTEPNWEGDLWGPLM